MPELKEVTKIHRALGEYRKSEKVLISLAKKQFILSLCPLHPNHYELSEKLFGQGYYSWTCGFCGARDSE